MTDTEKRLREIVSMHFGENYNISRKTNFKTDLSADSLDVVELIMDIEEEFDIQINDDETDGIETFGDMQDKLTAKLQNQSD